VLGLRWSDIEFEKATLQVAQSVELVGHTLSVKKPKTDRGRRAVTMPEQLVIALRAYRKEHAELCLAIGLGRVDLVFPRWPDDRLRHLSRFLKAFASEVKAARVSPITFTA
jgi:integrase